MQDQVSTAEGSVYERYAAAAQAREAALCCPTSYAADFLKVIPQEIIERDYGCGDPTTFAQAGDTVLDLGSGGGKLCYILSQVVGATGRVIGVDCNLEMLALARKYQQTVADSIGYANVDFRYGMIQDLALNLELLEQELASHPIQDSSQWLQLRNIEERLRSHQPLIADDSVDCVVSNCVLNLVRRQDRQQLFREIFRVLRPGGRAAISDIVCDEDVPQRLQHDPELWSGCVSGAFREDKFLEAFEEAGFHGIEIAKRQPEPWRTIEGIEFRSMTVVAYKGQEGPCLDCRQAVVYRGPFKKVVDEEGQVYHRGVRMAVCEKVFQRLQKPPYSHLFETLDPLTPVSVDTAAPFECGTERIRSPREMKGANFTMTILGSDSCCDDGSCC